MTGSLPDYFHETNVEFEFGPTAIGAAMPCWYVDASRGNGRTAATAENVEQTLQALQNQPAGGGTNLFAGGSWRRFGRRFRNSSESGG